MSHFSMYAGIREQSGHRVLCDGLGSVWQYWNVGCDVCAHGWQFVLWYRRSCLGLREGLCETTAVQRSGVHFCGQVVLNPDGARRRRGLGYVPGLGMARERRPLTGVFAAGTWVLQVVHTR